MSMSEPLSPSCGNCIRFTCEDAKGNGWCLMWNRTVNRGDSCRSHKPCGCHPLPEK